MGEENIIYSDDKPKTPTSKAEHAYIKAASINQLVALLMPMGQSDPAFEKTILMTYRSFTSPEFFLKKIMQRYNVPKSACPPETDKVQWKKKVDMMQLKGIGTLKKWIQEYWSV